MTAPTAQAGTKPACPSFVGARVMRVTRLDSCGRPAYGPDALVTSRGIVTVTFEPEVNEGESSDTRNINGEICVPYSTPDTMTGMNVSIQFCRVDPAAFQIMNPTWKLVRNAAGVITGFRIGQQFSDQYGFALELWPKVEGDTGDVCDPYGDEPDQDPNDPVVQNGYFLLPYVLGRAPDSWEITGTESATFTINGRTKAPSPWGVGPYLVTRDLVGAPSPLLQEIERGSGNGNFYFPQNPNQRNTDPDHFHADIVTVVPPEPSCGARPLIRPQVTVSCDGNTVTLTVTNLDEISDPDETDPDGNRPPVWVSWGDGTARTDAANAPTPGEVTHEYSAGTTESMVRVSAPSGAYRAILIDPAATLALEPDTSTVTAGQSINLKAMQTPGTGGSAKDVTQQADWSSSNSDIATVGNTQATGKGRVRGISAGTATITATQGCQSVSREITVLGRITGVSITPADTSVELGTPKQFQAMATREGGGSPDDVTEQATWTSDKPAYATVNNSDQKGLVTGQQVTTSNSGRVTISAQVPDAPLAQRALDVVNPVQSVALTPDSPTLPPGGEQQMTATATRANGDTEDVTSRSTWVSDTESVATVSASGLVTVATDATDGQTALITATFESVDGSTTVTVSTAAVNVAQNRRRK